MKFTTIALIATLATVDALKISAHEQIEMEAYEQQMSSLEQRIEANQKEAAALRAEWGWASLWNKAKKYGRKYI